MENDTNDNFTDEISEDTSVMQHSFVDLRQHILFKKVNFYRQMDDQKFEKQIKNGMLTMKPYTDYDLAMDIDNILSKSEEKIED